MLCFLNTQHTAVAGWFPYGRVMYEHGGGIDAPLGVVRMEFSDVLHDPQVVFPFHIWRGSYDGGITQGQCAYYTTNGTQLAPEPDSTPTEGDTQYRVHANSGYGSTAEHCVTVDWPAAFMLSGRQFRRGYAGPDSWMGSLIFESRDASGLYYRRNRYYDSEKQRFTQEDPAGIAGGINVYGFANGDPITYGDPYGLCPVQWICDAAQTAAQHAKDFWGQTKQMWHRDGINWIKEGMRGGSPARQLITAGTVSIAGSGVQGVAVFRAAAAESEAAPAVGMTVYRVFGENSNPLGQSWTDVDPRTLTGSYRQAAGLPDVNTGRFVVEGVLQDVNGVTVRKALPLDGNPGGLREVLIPDAAKQVRVTRISGVNPEY